MCLAVPGKLSRIVDEHGLRYGEVDFSGLIVRVCLELIPEAQVGDFVLVHAGTALQRVDEREARQTLSLLAELADADRGRE